LAAKGAPLQQTLRRRRGSAAAGVAATVAQNVGNSGPAARVVGSGARTFGFGVS
jgi:hypothetical protein